MSFDCPSLRVLHTFKAYLNMTENWLYALLRHLPRTRNIVASKLFLPCGFYSRDDVYLPYPIQSINRDLYSSVTAWIRLGNTLARTAQVWYPLYVARLAGRADLVHSHFAHVGWEYLNLPQRLNAAHIVSFYGMDYEYLPATQPVWNARYRQLFRRADAFLVEGEHGAQLLRRRGCPAKKIYITPLGVDTRKIQHRAREKRPEELRLLQVATLRDKKGHEDTVSAFAQALVDCPNMTLTLVGSDPRARSTRGLAERLRSMVRGTVAQDKVTFVDEVALSDLHRYMSDYHVFIHPSRHTVSRDSEGGAPVVLLDAQATGMPVIATSHCDIPEVVIHGTTGLLTPERDVDALATSIRQFYHLGSATYAKFSEQARRHVERAYDVRVTAAAVRSVYDDVLGRRRLCLNGNARSGLSHKVSCR